jgi:hypothetical protein
VEDIKSLSESCLASKPAAPAPQQALHPQQAQTRRHTCTPAGPAIQHASNVTPEPDSDLLEAAGVGAGARAGGKVPLNA